MNTTTKLTTDTIANITTTIADCLLRRGFTAKIVIDEVVGRDGNVRLDITSEAFQTVPVLFREIRIGGSIYFGQNETTENAINFGGTVNVKYEHFPHGSNGCELFRINGTVLKDDDRVFNVLVTA